MAIFRSTLNLPVSAHPPGSNRVSAGFDISSGVMFSFPEGETETQVRAICRSAMYWVEGGSTLDDVLGGFTPLFDSLIFLTYLTTPATNICWPFPSFFTYESIDRTSVAAAIPDIVKSHFPNATNAEIQSLSDDFFDNGSPIYCEPGAVVGDAAVPFGVGGVDEKAFWLRTWDQSGNELKYPHVYIHHLQADPTIPNPNEVFEQLDYGLGDDVGEGMPNAESDILLLSHRFNDLGFSWIPIQSATSPDLFRVIRLFNSIVWGDQVLRPRAAAYYRSISTRSVEEQFLWGGNAPQWLEIPPAGEPDNGFINIDHPNNNMVAPGVPANMRYDWGTNYLLNVLRGAGRRYLKMRDSRPVPLRTTTSLIMSNDATRPQGGETFDHNTHQTGLNLDIGLPRVDGGDQGVNFIRHPAYWDQLTTEEMIIAFEEEDAVTEIRFHYNGAGFAHGPLLPKRIQAADHDDHIHLRVRPPESPSPDL